MSRLKLTTWNIEHLGRLLPTPPAGRDPKLRGAVEEIRELDPDILCINEAPGNLAHLLEWVSSPERDDHLPRDLAAVGLDEPVQGIPGAADTPG
jgi:hypothetical protein